LKVLRATVGQADDARVLRNEYDAEVGVLDRDTSDGVLKFLSSADSGAARAANGRMMAPRIGARRTE
jgi:hypothetical protein